VIAPSFFQSAQDRSWKDAAKCGVVKRWGVREMSESS
jgi:exo-beta-1,3-glucanase (GH17 family)